MSTFEAFLTLIGVTDELPKGASELKSYLVEANKLLAQVVLLERLPGTSDDVQRFKKTIGDANNLAGDGRIGDARQLLEDVPEQINKSRSDAEHRQQLAVESENSKRKELQEQTKHKQLFEDKLTDAQQMLLTIQDLPGAEASWRDASNCLEQARSKAGATSPDYSGGLKDITTAQRHIEQGKKQHAERLQSLQKSFGEQFKLQQTCTSELDKCENFPQSLRDTFQKSLQEAMAPLLVSRPAPTAAADVKDELTALREEIGKAKSLHDSQQSVSQFKIKHCENRLEKLKSLATLKDIAPLLQDVRTLEVWLEQKEWQKIKLTVDRFDDAASDLEQSIAAGKLLWTDAESRLPGLIKLAEELATNSSPILLSQKPTAATVAESLKSYKTTDVGGRIPYAEAADFVAEQERHLQALDLQVAKYFDLEDARTAAEKKIAPAISLARKALDQCIQEINNFQKRHEQPELSYGGDFDDQLNDIEQRWQRNKQTALVEEQLEETLILKQLAELTELIKQAKGESARHKLVKQEKLREALKALESADRQCRDVLGELEAYASQNYDGLYKRCQELGTRGTRAQHPEQVSLVVKDLTQLTSDAKVELRNAQGVSLKFQGEVRKLFEQASTQLETFEKRIEQYDESVLTKSPQHKEYLKLLKDDLLAIEGQVEELDLDILQSAKEQLLALRPRITEADNDLQGRGSGKSAPTLENIEIQIARAKSYLKANDALATYLSATKGRLEVELKKIEGGKLTRHIDETMKLLPEWQQKFREAAAKAATAQREYLAFEKEVKEAISAAAKSKDEFKWQPRFYDKLQQDLKNALAQGKTEGGLTEARKTFQQTMETIRRAQSDPEVMLLGEQEAAAVEGRKEQDKNEWAGLYKAFVEKTLVDVENSKLYSEIKKLGAIAKETFERSADLTMARSQLELAKRRAADALAYPEGLEAGTRKKLPDVNKQWQAAVAEFRKAAEEVARLVTEADDTAKDPVSKHVSAVCDLFSSTGFEKSLKMITAIGEANAESRAAREEALRTIRRYQSYVLDNLKLQQLAANPFNAPFRAHIRLNDALFSLEKNLLICF